MSDLKLTPSLLSMLERIERHSGTLLMLAVTASGGQDGKLNKLRGAGYVVKCDHPSVTEGAWPAEALAITEAGRTALAKHRAEIAEKKGRHRPGCQRRRENASAGRSKNVPRMDARRPPAGGFFCLSLLMWVRRGGSVCEGRLSPPSRRTLGGEQGWRG